MKKAICLIAVLSWSLMALSQEVKWNPETKTARMESVIQLDSLSQETLYDRAKFWTASKLKSTDNQVLYDDEERKTIVVSGNVILSDLACTDRKLNFKMAIFFKEGRIKYIIDEILVAEMCQKLGDESKRNYIDDFDKLYEKRIGKRKKNFNQQSVDVELKKLVLDLEEALNQIMPVDSDDW